MATFRRNYPNPLTENVCVTNTKRGATIVVTSLVPPETKTKKGVKVDNTIICTDEGSADVTDIISISTKHYTSGGVNWKFPLAFTASPTISVTIELHHLDDSEWPLCSKITSLSAKSVTVKAYKAVEALDVLTFSECATNDVILHLVAMGAYR